MSATAASPVARRVAALDQFRGYTMAGMFLVNFIGGFAAVHPQFGHHGTYCSYADTIMPGFFFAVGFAFRLTHTRRVARHGAPGAARHAIWRNTKLLLIGAFVYNLGNFFGIPAALREGRGAAFLWEIATVDSFQPLVHIAVASLWILPVIGLSARARWAYLVFSCALHLLNLHVFYYDFAYGHVIDGGPLGFLGWAVPTLVGSLVCDVVRATPAPGAQGRHMAGWALGLMVAGYALACLNLWGTPGHYLVEPPFVPPSGAVDLWTMSQRTASPSYMLFGAGFSVAVYLLFVLVSDAWGWQLGIFRTFGKNPLFGYLNSEALRMALSPLLERDATLSAVLFVFAIHFLIIYATLRYLEHRGWYWRL